MPNSTRACTGLDYEVCICSYGEWYFSDCVPTSAECIDGFVSGEDYYYRDPIVGNNCY